MQEIIDKEALDNVIFEEIHFAHDHNVCGETYKKVVENLVLSENMKSLKKVALSFCACIADGNNLLNSLYRFYFYRKKTICFTVAQ